MKISPFFNRVHLIHLKQGKQPIFCLPINCCLPFIELGTLVLAKCRFCGHKRHKRWGAKFRDVWIAVRDYGPMFIDDPGNMATSFTECGDTWYPL